ncbi:hypothetical protein LguiA_033032 [Lonicera macranthoides]
MQSRMMEINSWEVFCREFENQFISDAYRRRKREELWMLRQEGMTVAEYHQKFESLCLHMDRPSDRERMEAFFFGLRADFRDVLSAYNYQTYKEVVEAAYWRDSVLMEPSRGSYNSRSDRLSYTADRGKKRSGFGDWERNKKAKSSSESSGGLYSSDGGSSTGSFSGSCYVCGQQGHRARSCPNNPQMNWGSRSRGEGSSSSRGSNRGRIGNRGRSQSSRLTGRSSQTISQDVEQQAAGRRYQSNQFSSQQPYYSQSRQSHQQSFSGPMQTQGQGNQSGRIYNLATTSTQEDHTVMEGTPRVLGRGRGSGPSSS